MNQKVADAYIKKGSKIWGKLTELNKGISDIACAVAVDEHTTKAFLEKLKNLSKELEEIVNYLQKKLLEVKKEIEAIEETRELTVQEEQEYIEQFSDIFKDGEEKTEKLEEAFNQLVN